MNKLQKTMVVILLSAIPCASNAQVTLLDADFESQTPGVTIGTGGAAAGEPVSHNNISAYPATNCYGSQCLAVVDNSSQLGEVVFGHLAGGDLNQGTIVVQFDIALQNPDPPTIRLRDETGFPLQSIFFSFQGDIYTGGQLIGTWTPLQQMSFQIVFYYSQNVFDVFLDDVLVLPNADIPGALGIATFVVEDTDTTVNGYALIDNIKIVDLDETYTGVPNAERPLSLVAFPNPFRSSTAIQFATKSASRVNLSIYDIAGRLVREITDGTRSGGTHIENWDGRDARGNTVSPGVYFSRVDVGGAAETKRITLVR